VTDFQLKMIALSGYCGKMTNALQLVSIVVICSITHFRNRVFSCNYLGTRTCF